MPDITSLIRELRSALGAVDKATEALQTSPNLVSIDTSTDAGIRAAAEGLASESELVMALNSALKTAGDAADALVSGLTVPADTTSIPIQTTSDFESGIPEDLKGVCSGDNFQGIRFYDGVSWGYLRLHPEKVELLVGEKYEYPVDGTSPHTYRITAKGKDIKLYLDGVEVVTATGKFTLPTTNRLIEFGGISGRAQLIHSAWQSFKYSIDGSFAGDAVDEFVLSEIMSLPGGGISAMKSYKGNLYVAFDPDDGSKSSCIYRYQEGFAPERRAAVAITRSNITSVVVDPGRPGNVFGTSGKFLGTDRGLQYILGAKPQPFDESTTMSLPPEQAGWRLDENCEGTCRNFFDNILTIDTRDELSEAFHKYVQGPDDAWGMSADNLKGWTVDAMVRISEDGGGEPLDLPTFYVPRDYVFVLDTSESVSTGNLISYIKSVMDFFLTAIHPGDSFNIITFNAIATAWRPSPVPASGDNVSAAMVFVNSLAPVSGGVALLDGLELAIAQAFSHPDKDDGLTPAAKGRVVVLLGSGDTTDVGFESIPGTVTASNIAGPNVGIYTVGIGNRFFTEDSAKKKVYRDLASDNAGSSFFVNDYDDIATRASDVWKIIAPESFDWDVARTGQVPASTEQKVAFLTSSNASCDVGGVLTPTSDLVPPEDGLNAPGILINDGTYQEVVQFFEKGIRLKYAKIFARLNMSDEFHTIRIIGKGKAIAVYAKSDSDPAFHRVIYAPDSLFVRAASIGAQEAPSLSVDAQGNPHTVWQDSKDGTWRIFYAAGSASDVLDSGRASTSVTTDIASMLSSRPIFGLPPATVENLPPNAFVAPNGAFLSKGVRTGDVVAFSALISDVGAKIRGGGRYIVERVISEVAIQLRTSESLTSLWSGAEYAIYRGEAKWTIPSLVSNQPMDSTAPAILAHSSGDIYVAYENVSSGSRDIYVRRGRMGGSSTAWKESVRLTHGKANNYNPRLAEDANGDIIVVWESNRLDKSRSQVFYAIMDTSKFGVTFDGSGCYSIKSLTADAVDARNPRIATCDQAIPIVVYESLDANAQWHVYAIGFDKHNSPGEAVKLSSGLEGDNHNPDITSCASMIYVAWDNDATGVREIMTTRGRCVGFELDSIVANLIPGAVEEHEAETGFKVTTFGTSIGLTDADASSAFSHSFFPEAFGMNVVDYNPAGQIITLAQRGRKLGAIGFGTASPTAGGAFISGHDSDYHAIFTAGAQHLLQKAVEYVSGGMASPNILYITDFRNPLGDQVDGRAGLIAAGLAFTCADAGLFPTEPGIVPPNHVPDALLAGIAPRAGTAVKDLRTVNFNAYDVIMVASGYGAWLRQDELDILNLRANDIADFINNGGGLVVWNQTGQRNLSGPGAYPGPTRGYYEFLPFITANAGAHGLPSGSILFDADSLVQTTNSRGDSQRPSVSCDLDGNAWIAFEDDRIRDGYFETYISKYDNKMGRWIGSNQFGMDVRMDLPVQYAKKPIIHTDDFQKSIVLFETQVGSLPIQVVGSITYDDIPTFDESVVAFFPLDENNGDNMISNMVVNANSSDTTGGIASHNTDVLSVPAPDTGVSLQNPTLQRAMRLDQNGKAIRIDKPLPSTGALELWLTPHWASTDATPRVILGTDSQTSLVPDTFSLSIGPSGGGNELKFRIVDTSGEVRHTVVTNNGSQNFTWAADESVHLRLTWDEKASGLASMNSISFLDSSTGLVVGPNGTIFRTSDGGQSWTKSVSGVTYDLYSVDYVSGSLALACGEFGTILRSTDGGVNWSVVELDVSSDINSIFHNLVSGSTYAVGSAGTIFRSIDSGVTWTPIQSPAIGDLNCVAVVYDGTTYGVIAVGSMAQILRSTDDGVTWTAIIAPSTISSALNYVSRSHQGSASDGFVSGNKGAILKTTNAGATWVDISPEWERGYMPNLLAISHSDDDNNVYVVGQNGAMSKSYDGGTTWLETTTAISQGNIRCVDAWMGGSSTSLVAIGPGGSVIASDDKAILQKYYIIKSGNLAIHINGKEPTQERTGDAPFLWTPSAHDLYLGDYRFSGAACANATFDDVVIYDDIPTSGSIFRRANMLSRRFDSPSRVVTQDEAKRIEWGNISPLSKARSHWESIDISFCGAKEPVMHFQWPGQLGIADDVIRDMALDMSGFLWVATENGIFRAAVSDINDDIEQFVAGQASLPNNATRFINYTNMGDGLRADSITSITVDGNNDVWVGTQQGLMRLERAKSGFTSSSSDPVQDAFFRENPELLSGSEKDASAPTLNAGEVHDVSISSMGKADGLPSNNITVVRAFKNIIYVGTDSGLAVLTIQATTSNADTPPGGTSAVSASEGAASNIQSGTGSAIDVARAAVASATAGAGGTAGENILSPEALIASNVRAMGVQGGGTVATATNVLIQVFTVMDGLPSNLIQCVAYDVDAKEALIGTDNGMARLSRDGHIIHVGSSSGLISNNISSISIDAISKRKYVGTSMGLTVIDGMDSVSYPPSSGIGYGAIQSSDVDGFGSVWFGVSTGLVEFGQKCEHPKFTLYDHKDGIIGDPNIRDFQRYKLLGGPIPSGGCEKALVAISVNGRRLSGGYSVVPHVPWIVLDRPLNPSDKVDVCVHEGWRRIRCFDSDSIDRKELAQLTTERLSMPLYRKRFEAGTVALGGNSAQGASRGSAMYFVVVVPLSTGVDPVISAISLPSGAEHITSVTKDISIYSDADELITLFPTALRGASAIAMPSADEAIDLEEYLEFELSREAIVYVAYDIKADALPGWLRSFQPVEAVYRVTDMEVFTDASGEEKLFVSLAGTNGCVYELLNAPDACDVSDSIALDALPPDGCAKITRVNSPTSVTVELDATDAVTGVSDMQVAATPNFTTKDVNGDEVEVNWVPFQKDFILAIPPAAISDVTEVVTTVSTDFPGIAFTKFFDWNGKLLIATKNPGRVYQLDKTTLALSLLFDTSESEVLSMTSFGSNLLVGTGTNGRAFLWDGSSLQLVSVPGGVRITAISAFDTRAFFGTSPDGKIYEMDETLNVQLFMDTFETEVNGFAIFGGRLYWVTGNTTVSEGDVLSTTTQQGHRHTFGVAAGEDDLSELNGTTSTVDGHAHNIINGVVQSANGHTHLLVGSSSGKVFRYDAASGSSAIVHSDRDHKMASITSTSLDASGLMFVGTYPNGRILRFVPEENIFIKSFDTTASMIAALRVVNERVNASADEDVFVFDGRRWVFQTSVESAISDILEVNGDILVLSGAKVFRTTITTNTVSVPTRQLCAFVRFRDAAGNVSKITDDTGAVIACYNPCVSISGSKIVSTSDNNTGGGGTVDVTLAPLVHRITEIDDNAKVVSIYEGPEPFLSGNKIEEEVGVYESEVFNGTNSLVQWVNISWLGLATAGTSITLAVRTSTTLAGIKTADWSDEFTSPTTNDLTNLIGQFLQFRATLKVSAAGVQSPELYKVDIQLRTSQAVHYFTTNFALPDELRRGILTFNGCLNPPVTDIVFAISGQDTVDFSDYYPIVPNKVFELPSEHRRKNLRVGIKLISSPATVPVVDEFALLFSLANDAIIRLNLPGMPTTTGSLPVGGNTRTVLTEEVQNHTHLAQFDSSITDVSGINGQTSTNSGHSHAIINGIVQTSAGHSHGLSIN